MTGFDEAVMLVTFGRVDMTGNDFVTFQSFFDQRPDAEIRLLEGALGEPAPAAAPEDVEAENEPSDGAVSLDGTPAEQPQSPEPDESAKTPAVSEDPGREPG